MESKEEKQSLSLEDLTNAIGISHTTSFLSEKSFTQAEPEGSLSSSDLLSALGYQIPSFPETNKKREPANKNAETTSANQQKKPSVKQDSKKSPHVQTQQQLHKSPVKKPAKNLSQKKAYGYSQTKPYRPKKKQETNKKVSPVAKTAPKKQISNKRLNADTSLTAAPAQEPKKIEEATISEWEKELRLAAAQIEAGSKPPISPSPEQPSKKVPSIQNKTNKPAQKAIEPEKATNKTTFTPLSPAPLKPVEIKPQATPVKAGSQVSSKAYGMKSPRRKSQQSAKPLIEFRDSEKTKEDKVSDSILRKPDTKPVSDQSKQAFTEEMLSVRKAAEQKIAERDTDPFPAVKEKAPAPTITETTETNETDTASPAEEDDALPDSESDSTPNKKSHFNKAERIKGKPITKAFAVFLVAVCFLASAGLSLLHPDYEQANCFQETASKMVYYLPEATLYTYDILGSGDKPYKTIEVAEFDQNGFLERSILTVNLDSAEQAEEFVNQAKETYQDDLLASSVSDNAAMLLVKPSNPNISQDTYTNLRKDTNSNCQIIGE